MLRILIIISAFLSSPIFAYTTVALNLGYTGLDLNGLENYTVKAGMGEFRSALGADTDNMVYGAQVFTNIKEFFFEVDFNYMAEETAKTIASHRIVERLSEVGGLISKGVLIAEAIFWVSLQWPHWEREN